MANAPPDEKKVYALIGAVGTNRDRLRQAIDSLRQIHDRWKGNNGTSINLIAQLTALKSNLGNIQDWLTYAVHDLHPQLLSDLDVLMASCGLLVRHMDALNSRLQQSDHDAVDFAIKLKYVLGSRSMERLRKVAQRQNDAVTLLLAACKCHASAQRKILLHKSRQIRKEDVSNLKTLARSSTWNGGCIRALTQVSRMIQWFRFLFHLKLQRTDPERNRTPTGEEYDHAAAAIRSEAIDRAIANEATALRRETKLVLVGDLTSGKELIMHQMKVLYAEGYYPSEERMTYRYAVHSTIRLLIHSIIDLLKDTGVSLPAELNQDFAILLHEVETVDMHHITPGVTKAVENIWSYPEFSTLYIRNFEIDFPQYAAYFAQEISRIASRDYVPSEADIIRLNKSMGGIKELRFTWDELDVHLFNINGYNSAHFQNRCNFESWANSPKFTGSSIILLLNNFTRFREKLQHSPLASFFPDYVPNDTEPETSARQYILRRFKDVNRNQLSIYSFWVDLDMSENQHLYAALKKTLQHIQQRKARSEVWNESTTTMGSGNRNLVGMLSPSRSLSRKRPGTGGSMVISSVQSEKTERS
ncbi:uncharacterized protein K460DRAFT_430247 [Cucurbitaria berberidis CBS 394.84]|uniref:Guanine nucleotide-binding protein alpha-3 subunit n=1 Tax=Cucurbitaria berberidis CBS 394.84 TaxID=1168544 RepID=A0A9P4GHH6_9PLEO|nr:uncharacterized protein K460DRAFT_430247 [Cucurbitaria berberidis CBS 394.84]KAF1845334.1 hypothetical protein K460DRAFT_430247 [Cucurbitaria berberidis CBS 394.84]